MSDDNRELLVMVGFLLVLAGLWWWVMVEVMALAQAFLEAG